MGKYQLKEVKTAKEAKAWLHMDRKIYEGNRNWVCPLDSDIEKVFDPKQNELFIDGEAIRWVAVDGEGEIVGRIAAFYNREQLSINENVGGCGFFESIDDQEVANMLFDAARLWLSSRGVEGMDGPVNFGSRDAWWGLLVQGYEFQPLYTNPYHLPYYKDLFENYGFQNYFNQNTYIWRVYDDSVNDIALEKAKRLMATPGYYFKDVRDTELDVAAEHLRIIYNKAWSLFTGVKPMEKEEAQEMLNSLKPIIDRNIIFFAYFNDEPIGFFVMVPDINRVIGKYKGNFNLINKLRLLWDINVRKASDRIFAIIFGITPEFQGKGIESGMIKHILETYIKSGKCHYKTIEFAWIGDFNPVMNRMIERYVCATKHKMHTTYRYWFDRTREFQRCPRIGIRRPENK